MIEDRDPFQAGRGAGALAAKCRVASVLERVATSPHLRRLRTATNLGPAPAPITFEVCPPVYLYPVTQAAQGRVRIDIAFPSGLFIQLHRFRDIALYFRVVGLPVEAMTRFIDRMIVQRQQFLFDSPHVAPGFPNLVCHL
jgi:hypothetical protein